MMFKAIVLLCTITEPAQCESFHNPEIINYTEQECVVTALDFINAMRLELPFPITASYACEYEVGV